MKLFVIAFVTLSCYVDKFGCDLLGNGNHLVRIKKSTSEEINEKWNATWTDKLKKDLLQNYDKFSRPAEIGTQIVVETNFVVRHIEMDEQKSTMTLHSWLRMSWVDEKLKWYSADYGGLKALHLADHEIWQPDIYPYNGVIGSVSDHFGNTNCIAYSNGTVLWVPPSIFQVFCQMDMTYWPFDTQVCTLVLGSWTYDGEQVDMQFTTSGENSNDLVIENSEWKFVEMTKERHSTLYSCCPVPYTDLTYNITVQRKSPTYIALLITPATAIIIMALSVFLIPPTSMDKITLCGATIIITCLFLLYFTQKLPVMAGSTPLIVLFYSRTLYLLSFSLIISITVINIAKNPKFSPLPWSIKRVLTGCLGKCLFISNMAFKDVSKLMPSSGYKPDEAGDSLPVLSEQEKQQTEAGAEFEKYQHDWMLLAFAIDRIAFVIYCLIFIIFAISYSV